MLEVNVVGVAHSIDAVLPGMYARRAGHIVGVIVRRTLAPILVWCCTCLKRNVSPTLTLTRSRSVASSPAWVPFPLPCTPMITYLRTGRVFQSRRPRRAGRRAVRRGSTRLSPPYSAVERVMEQRRSIRREARDDR